MTLYYYARVSTEDQTTDMQFNDAIDHQVDAKNIYLEKASGKSVENRPILKKLLHDVLKEGDTLLFYKIDRMARSVRDLSIMLEDLDKRGIAFKCTTQAIVDSTKKDYLSKFMIQILGCFAELERNIISERTKDGMAAAKNKGVHCGRPRKN